VKNKTDIMLITAGIFLFCAGIFLVKGIGNPEGIMKTLPFITIGIGCGTFGHGMGNFIQRKTFKKDPELQKKMEIETKDERNIAIGNSAKAKAYDLMIFVFGALILSFALMNINTAIVLLSVTAYLSIILYGLYYRIKFEKEM